MFNKILPMTGVEPRTSGIKSDRSTNWATTTSHLCKVINFRATALCKLINWLIVLPNRFSIEKRIPESQNEFWM